MIRNFLMCFFALIAFQSGTAQNVTAKIIDSEDNHGLAYASIQINDTENLISNAEGYFTIPQKTAEDAFFSVSFLGYKTVNVTFRELKENNLMIKLQPGNFELETVYISNIKVNADSIMAAVKRNLKNNYKPTGKPAKNTIFYREGQAFKPVKLKAEMTGATGYKKQQLNDANAELNAFTSQLLSHPPQEFTDMLCNYATATKIYKEKPVPASRFEVIKAVQLKDRTRSVDLDEMEKMASGVLFKHLDPTKYYRIKSGLFGTQDTVIATGAFYESKRYVTNKSKLNDARNKVISFMGTGSLQNSKTEFVNKQELYEYTLAGTTMAANNESVYIIKFRPKKRKGKYTGTLYVSEKDYAVVRADYMLGEGKTLGGVNLKFLLGIKQSENISKGTLIFKERSPGAGYYLQYGSIETGQYIYVNRPLKFIEIGKEEKHKVAFDLKVEANEVGKEEYFVMSRSDISEADFDKIKESDFDYIQLSNYDPNIWKEYNGIEPLEEMKQFRTVE